MCVCVCVCVCFVVCLVFCVGVEGLCVVVWWGGGGGGGGGGFWVLSLLSVYLNLASMLYTCFSIHCCISVDTPASC